jgi:hypothetical protein
MKESEFLKRVGFFETFGANSISLSRMLGSTLLLRVGRKDPRSFLYGSTRDRSFSLKPFILSGSTRLLGGRHTLPIIPIIVISQFRVVAARDRS